MSPRVLRFFASLTLATAFAPLAVCAADEPAAPTAPSAEATAATDQPALFSQGSRLIYKLSSGGTLLIEIQKFPARLGPVTFRFLFSDLGPSGTVTLTEEALKNATAIQNYFESGDFTYTDKVCVWLSQKLFADAKAGKPVQLDLGPDGIATFKLDEAGSGFMPLTIDAKRYGDFGAISTILLRSEDGSKTIRVKDDADAPLVVDMDTGSFTVRLSLHL
jgi:hypothetical protein